MWLHTVTIGSYRRSEDCADFILSIKQLKSLLLWLVPEDGSITTLRNVAVHRLTQHHILRQDRCENLHQKQELFDALSDCQFPNVRGNISCNFTVTPVPPVLPDFRKALLVIRVTLTNWGRVTQICVLHYNCARRMTQICVFNTRLFSLHSTLKYIEPVSEWSCWRMFIETWPHSELTFRYRASSI